MENFINKEINSYIDIYNELSYEILLVPYGNSKKGLILLQAGSSVIRISPPLIITKQQADKGLNILEASIKEAQDVRN